MQLLDSYLIGIFSGSIYTLNASCTIGSKKTNNTTRTNTILTICRGRAWCLQVRLDEELLMHQLEFVWQVFLRMGTSAVPLFCNADGLPRRGRLALCLNRRDVSRRSINNTEMLVYVSRRPVYANILQSPYRSSVVWRQPHVNHIFNHNDYVFLK